jgi:hypothetical protein
MNFNAVGLKIKSYQFRTNLILLCSIESNASRLFIQFVQFEIRLSMSTFSDFWHSQAASSILGNRLLIRCQFQFTVSSFGNCQLM